MDVIIWGYLGVGLGLVSFVMLLVRPEEVTLGDLAGFVLCVVVWPIFCALMLIDFISSNRTVIYKRKIK
jgi:hypothetical protein